MLSSAGSKIVVGVYGSVGWAAVRGTRFRAATATTAVADAACRRPDRDLRRRRVVIVGRAVDDDPGRAPLGTEPLVLGTSIAGVRKGNEKRRAGWVAAIWVA